MFMRANVRLSGLAPDRLPQDAPEASWTRGQNVAFRERDAVAMAADDVLAEGNARTVEFYRTLSGVPWIVYANETGIHAFDGAQTLDITPAGWAPGVDTIYTSCTLNGFVVVNASTLDPVFWDGLSAEAQVLPGWIEGLRVQCIRAHRNYLFGIGANVGLDQRVHWSSSAPAGVMPQEWTAQASNDAGFIDLDAAALDGAELRQSFMVYTPGAVYEFTFTGGPLVFQVRKALESTGLAATNCIVQVDRSTHMYLESTRDIHITDGVSSRSLLDGIALRSIRAGTVELQNGAACAAFYRREHTALFALSVDGKAAQMGVIVDVDTLDIGQRDLPDIQCLTEGSPLQDGDVIDESWDGFGAKTWDDLDRAWTDPEQNIAEASDQLIGGNAEQLLHLSGDPDRLQVPFSLFKTGISFGSAQRRKFVKEVAPRIQGRAGDLVRIAVGGSEYPEGPYNWTDPQVFQIGQNVGVFVGVSGRYIAVAMDASSGRSWRLSGLDVVFREAGQW